MRTVELRGGLGNQLFGLAFAHSIRELAGEAGVALPTTARRDFDVAGLARHLGLRVRENDDGRPGRAMLVREGRPPASAADLRRLIDKGERFRGYWQHPAFIAAPEALRREVTAALRAWCGRAPARQLAIHYRAYADEPIPWRRGVPPPAYFQRARALTAATTPAALVSDRPRLARRRLASLLGDMTVVGGSAADHMAVLLNAEILVLSNSSFSWWAGFCGAATRVFYPRRHACFHYPAPAPGFTVL